LLMRVLMISSCLMFLRVTEKTVNFWDFVEKK